MVATLVPVSFISAPYPHELVLQHVPTIAALIALAMLIHFSQISSVSFACLIAFLLLHIIGVRWIYSFVPYDAWTNYVAGTSLSERWFIRLTCARRVFGNFSG